MTTLQVNQRDAKTSADTVRREGKMPAVYYGRREDPTPIAVNKIDFLRAWREGGESSIITLERDDGDSVDTLIHDVQVDPVTEQPIHADFYVFERGKTIQVAVPLEFSGEEDAPAIKEQGGILVKVIHELTIESLPKDLPQHITVDVSTLSDFDSQVKAGDISLPEGVELGDDPEEVVVAVDQPQEEPEEEEQEEPDFSEIEVEGEKAEEESEDADSGDESSG